MLQRRNLVQHPLAVGPPQATGRIVVVVWLVGELVVMAMQPHPFDWAALAGQGAHQHQQPLKPFRGNEAAVGDQPVQAEGHPQHRHPIKNGERHHPLPAPELGQQGEHGSHVHHQHETGGASLVLALSLR